MQYSKYVYSFAIDSNNVALYHSLLIRTIFLTKAEIDQVNEILAKDSYMPSKYEIIDFLYQNYYIINNPADDEFIYKKCIDLISEPAISNVYVIVTENCNFNCKYCFISNAVQNNKRNKVMTKSVIKQTIDLLQKTYERQQHSYDKTITFYGGEPLLNFSMIQYFIQEVNRIKETSYWPDDVKYALITNGSLLNEDILNFLNANNIALSISFDIMKESHLQRFDKYGKDTFDVVEEKINLCKKIGVPFSLSITLTEDLLKHEYEVFERILSLQPTTIAYNLLIPNKESVPEDTYYERATEFMLNSFKILRKKGIYEDRIMRKVHSFKENKMHLYDCCAAGGNQFVITPDGQVGVCHGYLNNRKYFSDNIFNQQFDFKTNKDFVYWKNRTPLLMPECLNCECLSICGGGCPYAAEYMHGSIYNVDTRFCIHAKKILKWLISELYYQVQNTSDNI